LYGPNRTEKGRRRGGGEGNLYKVCELGISVDYQSMHLEFKLVLLGVLQWNVIFSKPSFSLPILQQDEPNHDDEHTSVHRFFQSFGWKCCSLLVQICCSDIAVPETILR
jgi:hypothetical protein